MVCKNCGCVIDIPEPKTIERVVTKEVKVDHSDGHYWIRVAFFTMVLAIFVTAGLTVSTIYSDHVYSKTINEPTIKVEITEYDSHGRVIKKFTR